MEKLKRKLPSFTYGSFHQCFYTYNQYQARKYKMTMQQLYIYRIQATHATTESHRSREECLCRHAGVKVRHQNVIYLYTKQKTQLAYILNLNLTT